jgi:signal transduction histidine kinase
MNTLLQQTLDGVRVLAQQLRPSTLDDLGLLSSFRWLVEDSRERLHLTVDLVIRGLVETHEKHILPSAYEIALFRIAQESLTNIARHARAHHVSLSLQKQQNIVTLLIADDGDGYDITRQKAGLGIFGMRERAELLGGELTIRSEQGKGTTVRACLPLPSEDTEASLHAR